MLERSHKYKELSDEELVELLTKEPLDNRLYEYFFREKCKKLLQYISEKFFRSTDIEHIYGEFYEFISEDNWYVLRNWKKKNSSSFNNYLTTCAVNHFLKESCKEKTRCSYEFIPNDPELITMLNHFTTEDEAELPPVWEAFNMLDERERTILKLLVIEEKSAIAAAPVIWKYIKSAQSLEQATEKKIQSTISMAKSRAILSLTRELEKIDKRHRIAIY